MDVTVLVQVELNKGPVTENLNPNLNLVWTDIELGCYISNKAKHLVVVGLTDTTGGIEDEDDVGLSSTCWC